MTPTQFEQDLQPLLLYAAPLIFVCIALEYWVVRHDPHHQYDHDDLKASIGIGIGSLLINGLFKASIVGLSLFCYEAVPWRLPTAWWTGFWRIWA